jgi:ABC-type spermidine/putrescine transport system permease subunit II
MTTLKNLFKSLIIAVLILGAIVGLSMSIAYIASLTYGSLALVILGVIAIATGIVYSVLYSEPDESEDDDYDYNNG